MSYRMTEEERLIEAYKELIEISYNRTLTEDEQLDLHWICRDLQAIRDEENHYEEDIAQWRRKNECEYSYWLDD